LGKHLTASLNHNFTQACEACEAICCFWKKTVLQFTSLHLYKMDISEQTVQKIQKFAENRQEAVQESAKEPLSGTALHVYTRRLDATLQGFQDQVKRQQDELNKVRQ
jgi:hypothetical protein